MLYVSEKVNGLGDLLLSTNGDSLVHLRQNSVVKFSNRRVLLVTFDGIY